MEITYALILLPLAFVFSFRNKVKLNFLTFFVFLCFCDGLVQILLPARIFTIYKILLLVFIILLILHPVLTNAGYIKKTTPGLKEFLFFVMSLLIVISVHENSIFSLVTLIRVPLMGYLFFILIFNQIRIPGILPQWILLIKRLLIIQIIATVLKYYMMGFSEKPVTTISAMGGSAAVILPVMMAVIVLALYLFNKKDKRLFLLLPLILLIGFINSKRGIWIFLPIVLVLTYSIWYFLRFGWERSIPYLTVKLPVIITTGLLIFYVGVRLNRSLNPDNRIWGKFDFEYAVRYIGEYSHDEEYYEETRLVKGRQAGLSFTLQKFFTDQSVTTALFGIGPDKIIAQQHQSDDIRRTGIESRGSMTGLVQYMWAAGVLPVIIYLLFIARLLRFSFRSYSRLKGSDYAMFPFAAILFCFVFFIDFIFYTTAFINILALQILFYSFIAFCRYFPEQELFSQDMKDISKVLLRDI